MIAATELRSWTTPGAQDAAKRTYDSVKAALAASPAVSQLDVDIFLQGSYANATNTRGDSDIDIVVMMRSSYMPDLTRLSVVGRVNYEANRIPATTTVYQLRTAVITALESYYGSSCVHPRNKCVRVDKRDGYVDADVVPCQQHRLYTAYPPYGSPSYIEGISIQPLTGNRIVNYPKEHIKNGQTKNGRCSELYKPTVRQIKRLRRRAVDAGKVGKDDAPGYLLECLTYNVPDIEFVPDGYERVIAALAWLKQFSPQELAAKTKSCDEVHWLFTTDPGNHNQFTAQRVIQALWDFV